MINKATAFVLNNIDAVGVDFNDPSATFEQGSPKTVRVLDYACGPGTITNILNGHATDFTGIDLSPNMVEEYNKRFSSDQSPHFHAEAVVGNLTDPSGTPADLASDKFFNFNLVAVGFGFHHFDDLRLTTARLTERLKPGGVLMILDFKPHAREDMHQHPASNTVVHHGFDDETVRKLFEGAGLEDFKSIDMNEVVFLGQGNAKRVPFMARARKPVPE